MRQLRQSSAPLDPAVLLRHVRPGPRYTSYPPATEFKPDFTTEAAMAELARLRREAAAEPLSIYLHIPFCSSLCWYCGCNVVATKNRDVGSAYVTTLCAEIALLAKAVGVGHPVAEVSIGGGSPNFLPIDDHKRVTAALRANFDIVDGAELGIELDPRDTSEEQVANLAELGYSRVSVGVQDFDAAVQKAIHREQSIEQTAGLIAAARRYGFKTVNVDLVYGLPQQNPATLASTLDAILEMAPQRVAWFGYAHLPHLRPHQKLVERAGPLPDITARAELLTLGLARLTEAGYERVGFDHFAQPDDALAVAAREGRLHRNFQGYVVPHSRYLLACGATGISDSGNAYWQNQPDFDKWAQAIAEGVIPVVRGVGLDADDQLRGHVIRRLLCDGELEWAAVDERYDIHFEDYFAAQIDTLDGPDYAELVAVDRQARKLIATPLGCNLIRNVAMVFDRYLAAKMAAGKPAFSLTL